MNLITQRGDRVLNLSKFDYLAVDDNEILAYRGADYTVIGVYKDKDDAIEEFSSIIAALSREDSKVIRMR